MGCVKMFKVNCKGFQLPKANYHGTTIRCPPIALVIGSALAEPDAVKFLVWLKVDVGGTGVDGIQQEYFRMIQPRDMER